MPQWLSEVLEKSAYFMPHGHCYLWIPWLLWLHVGSDFLIGAAYVGIALVLWALVRRIRLPFSPVFVAFALFIGLCGLTHFMEIWTVWNPDYIAEGLVKAATAAASVATAIGLVYVRPQVENVVHAARLSEERRIRLESTNAELATMVEKVKELDELRSQLFANVSHELRTPLALILGPTEQLLQADNLSAAQRRQLQTIAANGRMLLRHVNDLLDIAKLEAGTLSTDYGEIDLAAHGRRIASHFEIAAEQRGIALSVEAPDRLVAQVDADKVERILINLLSNAIKFTPDHGRVRMRIEEAQDRVRIEVADSGPGIAPEHRESVFERFRQVEGRATRTHGGTGLGLAIVREFALLHRGTARIDGAPEGGTLVTVELPRQAPAGTVLAEAFEGGAGVALQGSLDTLAVAVAAADTDTDAQVLPIASDRARVLVVEDNADMRAFIAETLAGHFNVVTAANGHQGLQQARALRPDVVVSDVMMPGLSGDQLVAALRADPAFATTPILLLIARADDELRVRLLAQGAQDYVTKPFHPQELLARVHNLARQKLAGDTLREGLATLTHDLGELARQVVVKNRQLQNALDAAELAREAAESASLVKSHFLGMISHELRTPLSTLDMNLQLLLREASTLSPAMSPRVYRMRKAAHEMSTLIEGLLEYARVESGRLEVVIESVDVRRLIDEVVEEQRDLTYAGVPLAAESDADFEPIRTDPRLLRILVTNLVSNALKFTREGTVTVRARRHDGGATIEVEDTGIGIPAQDFERIFEPFEQLEPLARKSIPGVGLGLALVKRIVEALGGEIRITSAVDRGTTFRVVVPSRQAWNPQ